LKPDFMIAHDDAVARGEDLYIDPETGYHVFTELAHRKRGRCCGSACRHCPFDHINVRDRSRLPGSTRTA